MNFKIKFRMNFKIYTFQGIFQFSENIFAIHEEGGQQITTKKAMVIYLKYETLHYSLCILRFPMRIQLLNKGFMLSKFGMTSLE